MVCVVLIRYQYFIFFHHKYLYIVTALVHGVLPPLLKINKALLTKLDGSSFFFFFFCGVPLWSQFLS